MKPTHQLAHAAAVFQSQYDYETGSPGQEYRDARQALRDYRNEHSLFETPLPAIAASILAAYVLSIPDQFEEGRRAGYAEAQPQAEPNPMPSLFERFGK